MSHRPTPAPGRSAVSPHRPLNVGVAISVFEGGLAGATPRWSDLREIARAAEAVGVDSLWVPDHLIFRMGEITSGMWEGWSILSALAAVTRRVELGTFVACAAFRNPALLAKMADTVDEISGGRLILGLGAGWHEPEFTAFGFPFDHRVDRFAEAVTIIAGLLRDGHIDFAGAYHQARDCELRPRGPRPGGPPIMIGTTGKRMLELTVKHADQWNVWLGEIDNDVAKLAALVPGVDAACVAAGRDPATLGRSAAVHVEVGPRGSATLSDVPLRGTPEELAMQLRAYAEVGVAHLQILPEPLTIAGIEAFGRVLEVLDRG